MMEKMERVGGRQEKNGRTLFDRPNPQWAVVPMGEEGENFGMDMRVGTHRVCCDGLEFC